MDRDLERVDRIREALKESPADALVCTRPSNVLLVSGYWPVIGTAIAIITSEGHVSLIAPEDEADLAKQSWADAIDIFSTGSLDQLTTAANSVRDLLPALLRRSGLNTTCKLALDTGEGFEPATYAAMHLYGDRVSQLLAELCSAFTVTAADEMLMRLRATLTPKEIEKVRAACGIAEDAFLRGAKQLRSGLRETEAAACFSEGLSRPDDTERAGGFVYCMSGPNSADAYRSYQRSSARSISSDDLILIHCNSYVNGFWTDITRTFSLAPLSEGRHKQYEAIFAARAAALETIRPGVRCAEVDKAARDVMTLYGFRDEFKHGLGHAVGFAAIDHNAAPRLHPASTDTLANGMVFNVEPAIYFENRYGLRHCDMVAVTGTGAELLTPFQTTIENLVVT